MANENVWSTDGFTGFSRGTVGNAGQNLYVSKAGVLQRIHQYDLNKDGYMDLVFCNSQNHHEKPPAYVYRNPLGTTIRTELPADGARTAVVADLNDDGYDDIVIGNYYNGIRMDLNATIYYGSSDGYGERRLQQLPAPRCTSVTAGDFNGDGRTDLAFLCAGKVRLFTQSDVGFEPKRFTDLDVEGEQLVASDLDGDGYADLILRTAQGNVVVYWGGSHGIDPSAATSLTMPPETDLSEKETEDLEAQYAEYVEDASPLVQVLRLGGVPHIFVCQPNRVHLVPVDAQRRFGTPLTLSCSRALSAATGDINGNGTQDLVFACRQPFEDGECSWIYWGGEGRYNEDRRTRLPSLRACDVVVGDLDSDGYDDIVLCQSHTEMSFSADSLIYRGAPEGIVQEPVRLLTHDARRVQLARSPDDPSPKVVFANYFARNLVGNIDISVYLGDVDGYSPERRMDLPGWGTVEAVCCDINDDGLPDLVLANASENAVRLDPGSFVYLNGPEGYSDAPTWRMPTTRAHGVCCADLNRDGYLDLIFCGFNYTDLLIFYGTAGGFDTASSTKIRIEYDGVVYKEPRWIYLADLNNDGWLDLVVPQIEEDRSFVLWGGPDGFSMSRCQALSVVRAACARAADLSGNGYLDLIVGGHMPAAMGPHDSFVYVYWNGPDGLREDRKTLLPAKAINSMAVGDFNNDGLLDIFICSYHGGHERDVDSYIYWNRAGRGFSAADFSRMFTHSASGCVAGDFNEDGWLDLAVANHKVWGDHVGWSAVWWNGPEGFSEDRQTRLPTSGPHGMVAVGPGNIMDRGPEEYYVSSPFHLPQGANVTSISWQAEIPAKTWVKAQLRFAVAEEGLAESVWMGPDGGDAWFENEQTVQTEAFSGQWVQYRLALGAINSGSTPRVTEVNVHYGRA